MDMHEIHLQESRHCAATAALPKSGLWHVLTNQVLIMIVYCWKVQPHLRGVEGSARMCKRQAVQVLKIADGTERCWCKAPEMVSRTLPLMTCLGSASSESTGCRCHTCEEPREGRRLAEGVRLGRGAGTTVSFWRPACPQLAAARFWVGSGADRMLLAPRLSMLCCRVGPKLDVASSPWDCPTAPGACGARLWNPSDAAALNACWSRVFAMYVGVFAWLGLVGLLEGAALEVALAALPKG